MANVVLVLDPDRVSGYLPMYAHDSFAVLHRVDGMLFLNLGQESREMKDCWS
jgi:hypothetical protein